MKKTLLIPVAMLLLAARPVYAIVWDFDDGPQGWLLDSSDTASFTLLHQTSGGNPASGGFIQLQDDPQGGGGGLALAPLLGSLSGFVSISWDALHPDNWSPMFDPASLLVFNNTTTYTYTPAVGQAGAWVSSGTIPLDGAGWDCSGMCAVSFADVLADDTVRIAFDLEVYWMTGLEAGLDNVTLNPVPVPAAVWLFGSGLLGLVGIARHRAS